MSLPNTTPNYYINTAINLCVISYEDIGDITGEVQSGLNVTWGPAQLVSDFGISYSLMYIVNNSTTGEYFVVIRGTNPTSLYAWISEDFDVGSSNPLNSVTGFPSGVNTNGAIISTASYNGITDLLSLQDPCSGLTALAYLQSVYTSSPFYLYVTGHSLGGTLTPVLYAYLNAVLYNGVLNNNMALWSFAGLAAGGDAFNNFLNSLITSGSGWRVQNNLDIAPLLFWNQSAVEAIYDPTNPWHSISPEAAILDHPFKIANASGVGYEQPTGGGVVLTGTLITTDFWVLQAAAQHHSFTYQSLVQSQFPQ